MKERFLKCPECDHDISLQHIRNYMRDKDISASEFGQWIHDALPRVFDWCDIDGISYKMATGVLRIIEEKKPGQELKDSQERILPLLAISINWLISIGKVHKQSGIFVVWTEEDKATIKQIPNGTVFNVDEEKLRTFIMGGFLEELE